MRRRLAASPRLRVSASPCQQCGQHRESPRRTRAAIARRLSRAPRRGLTLLELILALALSVVILGLVALAINLHLRMLDARRTDVDEAKIARAVLRMMADDLRGTLPYVIFDESGIDELLASGVSGFSGDLGGLGDDLGGDLGGMDDLIGGSGSDTAQSYGDDIEGSTGLPATPGLYGNQYELEVDVSRLPRVDQYRQFQAASDVSTVGTMPTDVLSDVKTVAYYVRYADGTSNLALNSGGQTAPEDVATTTGLVRREVDRAVTLYAASYGGLTDFDEAAEVIAPEVTWVEFAYFDGREWWSEWNSEEQGGLPMAVEISIGIQPLWQQRQQGPSTAPTNAATGVTPLRESVYRMVVRIPAAQPIPATSTEADGLGGDGSSQVLGSGSAGGTGQ